MINVLPARVVIGTGALLLSGCKQAREWAERRAEERREEKKEADAVHATEPAPIVAYPDGPGLSPGAYKLVEVQVEALPTTAKGKAWDDAPGDAPDLEIVVHVDGERIVRCKAGADTLVGRCKLHDEVRIDAASRIQLTVFDADTAFDDVIGHATLSDPTRWGTGMAMPLVPAERVRSATLILARGATWWDVHRFQLIGVAGGIAFALGVLGMWRSSLLPPPPTVPHCAYCDALLAAADQKCPSCGAVPKKGGAA